MKFTSSTYNVGYPVYGSKFLNNTMLLVAGGGGEGNNGIPNKLTVLRVDFEKKKVVKRFREITLDPNDDSPTTLDAANDLILMGCNENSEKIKSGGGNRNLRKFVYENEHLRFVASVDFDGSVSPEDYTKLLYMSRDGSVGAIASSKVPTVIRIIDPRSLEEKYEIETGHDVKDMHFAPDGKVIGYITASTLEIISIVTGRFIIRKSDFDKNYILSKVRFLTDDVVLIAASLQKGTGVVLIKISLKSGSATVLKTKLITNKFKGFTSMDVDANNQLAVIAGNDNSIALVKLKDFSLGRIFKQVHGFAITRVAFSPDSKLIASVSAANTVNVIRVPEGFALSTSLSSKIWRFFVNFILIIVIASLAQFSYRYNLHERSYKFLKHQYLARRNGSSGGIDILKQTTLVGDIVSQMTTTQAFDTTEKFVETSAFNSHTVGDYMAHGTDDDVWLSESWVTSTSLPHRSSENMQAGYAGSSSVITMVSGSVSNEPEQVSDLSATASKVTDRDSYSSLIHFGDQRSEKNTNLDNAKISSQSYSAQKTDVISAAYQFRPDTAVAMSIHTSSTWASEGGQKPTKTSITSLSVKTAERAEIHTRSTSSESLVERQNESNEKSQRPIQASSSVAEAPLDINQAAINDRSSKSTSGAIIETNLAQSVKEVETKTSQAQSSTHLRSATTNSVTKAVSKSSGVLTTQSASKATSKESSSGTEEQSSRTKADMTSTESEGPGHAAVTTEDEFRLEILDPSGAEIDYDLFEEKTPEPNELLSAERDMTTPTGSIASMQDSTRSSVAIPVGEESLETGKDNEHSAVEPTQEKAKLAGDDAMTNSHSEEVKFHVEITTKPSSSSPDLPVSSNEVVATGISGAPKSPIPAAVQASSNEVQASKESLKGTTAWKHMKATDISRKITAASELPLEIANESTKSTSARSFAKAESESAKHAEISFKNEMKPSETVTSIQANTISAHSETEVTEQTSIGSTADESSISSAAQDTVIYDEL
ncbi:hypothetical protein HG536_0A09060 [Torulaspora globosa]|uniref:Guanine nucleotide-exchange factor SEC12 n=1 Tax=Torulaspora globosa TaxID=48254 RepID=A0A7G3ZC53_9SACH|nr:uncharacterized protein HG536_0A09060 [Torulaspora globosa]QLL31089.1 hypothetical protein HG536_0A09060 [Torulaspora globosa]